jgi:lipopolysaccharide/colanic/teichoic acid biosynthesis glycosyltransferase
MQIASRTPGPPAPAIPVASLPPVLHSTFGPEARFQNPSASGWSLSPFKRIFDLLIAIPVLAVIGLPMLGIAWCVRLTSPGPAFFPQQRVGRGGRLFRIYKLRSMTFSPGAEGLGLTCDGDHRITGLGRWLRKLKLDELPQFYNVLRGEMSLVGPRPKLPQYAGIANMPYRPGITGAATLAFRREEEMLRHVHPSQLDLFYDLQIRPLKARIDVRYMCRATFWSDLRLIGATFLACLAPARTPVVLRDASARSLAIPPQPPRTGSSESFEAAN